jgi:RIO-like serine/threonine protein kinase
METEEQVSTNDSASITESLSFISPKLLSHKPHSQVILCSVRSAAENTKTQCVLKFFPPKANAAFRQELLVYSKATTSESLQEIIPEKLWSESWTASRYHKFLANLPSVLAKSDRKVDVLAISYIEDSDALIESEPPELHIYAAKAALRALQELHENKIVHGDVSVDNLLVQREFDQYFAYWVDFSQSRLNAKQRDITYEWQKAVDYFADLVNPQMKKV